VISATASRPPTANVFVKAQSKADTQNDTYRVTQKCKPRQIIGNSH